MKTKNIHIIIIILFISILFSCSKSDMNNDSTGSETGKAGSMARFAVVGDYLYTVSNSTLNLFNIENDSKPYFTSEIPLSFGIETIFPKDSFLFIGSQSGMIIYSIKNAATPEYISEYWHMTSCDPVIVDGTFAYVTLHSNTENNWCGTNNANELHIIDITDIYNPFESSIMPMTRPLGLGINNNQLFLCDDGLKVYNIENTPDIELVQHFNINANDVIPLGDILLVIGDDGLYQYSYSGDKIEFISKLEICNSNIIP